jgi:uroporphyrin-III C-methyltransferase/precorrin-2 dehydrogenase/sirohydrochlorin ferrochelatase/uroporphyrin-III C-methyltransferase
VEGQEILSPSLVIIGKVVALHEQYAWMNNSSIQDYYFKPVDEQAALTNKPVNH